jgi:N utilization substance protein A
VLSVEFVENEKDEKERQYDTVANVLVPGDEVSKAIGKGGVNIRLACKLTGCEIDVYREVEVEDDIDLVEFEEDFGPAVIEQLHEIGCDTARQVIELDEEEIVRRTEGKIDEEEAERIIDIIAYEFEDEED